MSGLHIGLIGCGPWGRLILRDLLTLDVRVHAVARSATNREAALAGGAMSAVAHIDDLSRVDGAVVATPASAHAATVAAALGLGVPVFCEKPLTDDPAAARLLAARAPNRLFVMDKWRYHPGVLALAAVVRSGELGPVRGLKTRRLGWGDFHPDVDCAWTLLPHDLAIALEILGRVPAPQYAAADVSTSGRLHSLTAFFSAGAVWHLAEVGIRTATVCRSVELLCAGGTALLADSYADHVVIQRGEPPRLLPTGERTAATEPERRACGDDMPLLAELRAFVAFLRGGPAPRSSAAEGAAIVAAVAGARALAGLPRPARAA